MADAIFDIASLVSDVTEEEANEIFKPQSRRAPNFDAYVLLLNTQDIGQRKHVDIPKDHADPVEAARVLRYNMNEAAKQRTVWKTAELTDDEASQFAANKKIDRFERDDGTAVTRMKGGEWKTEVKEPVILRWKIDTREEEREVTEGDKTVKKTVKVPTRMHYISVATEAIRHRSSRRAAADAPKVEGETPQDVTDVPNANGVAPEEVRETVGAGAF